MKYSLKRILLFLTATLVLLLALAVCTAQSNDEPDTTAERIHAVDEYRKKWNISISSCKEEYFTESDHTAFNEGDRYSVLNGTISLPDSGYNQRGEKITKTSGSGADLNAGQFAGDVWYTLDVPEEYRFSFSEYSWVLYSTEDGDKLLIVFPKDEETLYIAEALF